MPEYLAPGVCVEEVSFRAKTIEGVPTSTTGFACAGSGRCPRRQDSGQPARGYLARKPRRARECRQKCYRKRVPASRRPEVAVRGSWTNVRRRNLAVRTRNGCISVLIWTPKTEISR